MSVILAAAAGTALLSAAVQAYTAAKARGASAAELAKIEQMVNALQTPDFDMSTITPELYQLVGEYNPQFTDFVTEVAPSLIEGKSEAAQEGLAAQRDVLRRMQEVGR